MNVIELKDIVKSYQMGDTIVYALNHVTVNFEKGKFTSIVGPSGSGKSTMMNILAVWTGPPPGNIIWKGRTSPTIPTMNWPGPGTGGSASCSRASTC